MPDREINLLDKWWKILTPLVAGIFYGTIAWVRIGDNTEDIKDLRHNFNVQLEVEKQKRADRVASTDLKLEKVDKRDEEIIKRINQLEQELSYLKGQLNSNKK